MTKAMTGVTPSTTARSRGGLARAGVCAVAALGLVLAACNGREEPGVYLSNFTLIDPSERHPIMVTQQPAALDVRVPRGAQGLSPQQARQVAAFLEHYRHTGASSRLVISVPSGSSNERAAERAASDIRALSTNLGFSDSVVALEPYPARRSETAPVRLAYVRFVAEPPACGEWPSNLAFEPRNLTYPNFGCAQQHNLAAQIANPADLLGPRSETPADQERRETVFEKYENGQPTGSLKNAEQEATTAKSSN